MVRALIAVRRPRDVDGAVIEQEGRALIVGARVERDVVLRVTPVARSEHARLDDERAAGPLGAVTNVERVQPLDERAVLLGAGDEVHRLRQRVDDRRAADADVAGEVPVGAAGLADVGPEYGNDAGCRVRVVDVPERCRRRGIVGVEGIDAVVVGGDVDDIPDAETRNVEAVYIEWLTIDLVVDGALEELAELADVDVRRRQHRFGKVRARPGGVVVLGRDVCLREYRSGQKQRAGQSNGSGSDTQVVACTDLINALAGRHTARPRQEPRHYVKRVPVDTGEESRAVTSPLAVQMCHGDGKNVRVGARELGDSGLGAAPAARARREAAERERAGVGPRER